MCGVICFEIVESNVLELCGFVFVEGVDLYVLSVEPDVLGV